MLFSSRTFIVALGLSIATSGNAQETPITVSGTVFIDSIEQRDSSGTLIRDERHLFPSIEVPLSFNALLPPLNGSAELVGPWATPAFLTTYFDDFFASIDPRYSMSFFQPNSFSAHTSDVNLWDADSQVFRFDFFTESFNETESVSAAWSYGIFGGAFPLSVGSPVQWMNSGEFVGFYASARLQGTNDIAPAFIDLRGFAQMTATVTSPIPEPEAYAMLLAGLALLGFEARRRKKARYPAA
jgi:hypothetical protein